MFLYKHTHACASENLFPDGQTCDSWQLIFLLLLLCVMCVCFYHFPAAMSRQHSQADHVPSGGGVESIGPHHGQELLQCWAQDMKILIQGCVNGKEEKETSFHGERSLVQMADEWQHCDGGRRQWSRRRPGNLETGQLNA